MSNKNIIPELIAIHNRLAEISVKGDDVIRMAEVIQKFREIIFNSELNKKSNAEELGGEGIDNMH